MKGVFKWYLGSAAFGGVRVGILKLHGGRDPKGISRTRVIVQVVAQEA